MNLFNGTSSSCFELNLHETWLLICNALNFFVFFPFFHKSKLGFGSLTSTLLKKATSKNMKLKNRKTVFYKRLFSREQKSFFSRALAKNVNSFLLNTRMEFLFFFCKFLYFFVDVLNYSQFQEDCLFLVLKNYVFSVNFFLLKLLSTKYRAEKLPNRCFWFHFQFLHQNSNFFFFFGTFFTSFFILQLPKILHNNRLFA